MDRHIITTEDGSHSVSIPDMNVTYHSLHGAIQESQHVFIQAGLIDSGLLNYVGDHKILEVGFGTGLNALLTLIEAEKHQNRIYYTAMELYPLNETETSKLNYCEQLDRLDYKKYFEKMHGCDWEEMFEITTHFRLTKLRENLLDFISEDLFSIIYFDAFAPAAQPELWTRKIFEKLYTMLLPGGVLVTYCSKGDVRRNMIATGFNIEKLPGPKGKREMLRAKKPMIKSE